MRWRVLWKKPGENGYRNLSNHYDGEIGEDCAVDEALKVSDLHQCKTRVFDSLLGSTRKFENGKEVFDE